MIQVQTTGSIPLADRLNMMTAIFTWLDQATTHKLHTLYGAGSVGYLEEKLALLRRDPFHWYMGLDSINRRRLADMVAGVNSV